MKTSNKTKYKNYFKGQYRSVFSKKDIENYRKWFFSQWRLINSKININPKNFVLEIGSGMGGFYSFLKENNVNKYVGVEMDRDAVEFANSTYGKEIFYYSSIEEFDSTDKFDTVFAFEVLEHLDHPEDAIIKIGELLKKDGIFCGTSPYPYSKNILADKTHIFVLHPQNWKRLFLENGYKSVELYPLSFIPFLWRINKRFNIRLPFYVPFPFFVSTCLIIAKK